MRPLRILTWHVHGNYLHYLGHAPHHFLLPVDVARSEGYGGCAGPVVPRENVFEIAAQDVRKTAFDLVLCQSRRNWEVDRPRLLAPHQLDLPVIYLEHDPPRSSPTDARHPIQDAAATVVHVTPFNALMWDNGDAPVRVIEHGVPDLGPLWTGERASGLTVVNGLARRGRRLGADVFARARQHVPLELVGMEAERAGGLGEVKAADLPGFAASYRFFFHPIRWTSLGLALCEAMMAGMPPVALATAEVATVIRDGENGFADTDERRLHYAMSLLLADRDLAARLGAAARETALARFGMDRFTAEWSALFQEVTAERPARAA